MLEIKNIINLERLEENIETFKAPPFDHCVIDDFFDASIAKRLEDEFPSYENEKWFSYKNSLEDKKALNDWNVFPNLTYQVFRHLVSEDFVDYLSQLLGIDLLSDPGLHGGGWHIHAGGGNLNPHLDYSIHPKCGFQRKLNIIVYLSRSYKPGSGGELGLWSHDGTTDMPGSLIKTIEPRFNRAVIFDTTQNSWHGMVSRLRDEKGLYRKSLAVYYLTEPAVNADPRQKVKYAPRDEQKSDCKVLDLIEKRKNAEAFSSVYRVEPWTEND